MYSITGLMICFNIYNGSVDTYNWEYFGNPGTWNETLNSLNDSEFVTPPQCEIRNMGISEVIPTETNTPQTDY